MIVTKEIQLDYGHVLTNHSSHCNQLHGHRAKIIAGVTGAVQALTNTSSEGMVIDFGFLKIVLMEKVHGVLDHGFAVWSKDPDRNFICRRNKRFLVTDEPPTAEYLAKWAYKQIVQTVEDNHLELDYVEWWETPTCCAIFSKNDYLLSRVV